jgi:hypothetical protein
MTSYPDTDVVVITRLDRLAAIHARFARYSGEVEYRRRWVAINCRGMGRYDVTGRMYGADGLWRHRRI